MELDAKELLIIFLGIAGTLIFTLAFGNKLANYENLSSFDYILLLILSVIAVILVIYKRIGELGKDIEDVKKLYDRLDERLKIHDKLINLEARIISLENYKHGKKK